ncbi:MAG: response regulator transcription factor [Eubacteriales bacterium]|nr:response regulator transcription factor [Eubacteriales bacterium]
MTVNRILIIDDDKNICELLELYLQNAGFGAESCNDGRSAMDCLIKQPFDLVLLDVMLPDMTGYALCRAIKEKKDLPVIMITARDMLKDKIQGFNVGADDYIIKPFEPAEVIARINARLRGQSGDKSGTLAIGDLTVNIDAYEVRKNGVRVDLKPKEVQLLYFLLRNRNIVFSRDTLLQKVWDYEFAGDTRTVDVHIKTLRQKLIDDGAGWDIKTVWGVGYKLEG